MTLETLSETMGVFHYNCENTVLLCTISLTTDLKTMSDKSEQSFKLSDAKEISPDLRDWTTDCSDCDIGLKRVGPRRKGKPKKFGNLSEIDIEEKRKVANVQERKRMKKLSKALEDLRTCIPAEYHISSRKMSKIRTLRLAVNYIASLTEIIERDNLLKQQAFHLESHMLQATFSYRMPSPFFQQGSNPNQQCDVSAYHTPCTTLEQRFAKRHLNFSPFCGMPSPSTIQSGIQLRLKTEHTPFKTPEMISRRRTSTIPSPFVGDARNLNELNSSFVSPVSDSDTAPGPSRFHNTKDYTYTLDGISPLPEDNFHGGTDCAYDPSRRRHARNSS